MVSALQTKQSRSNAAFVPLKKLPGCSQSLLVRQADAGRLWVLKRDDGSCLLENEIIGTFIFSCLGLPVPKQMIFEGPILPSGCSDSDVSVGFVDRHLLSSYLHAEIKEKVFEIVPPGYGATVTNANDFLGSFLVDICLGNADYRQAIFVPEHGQSLRGVFIDHSHLFGERTGKRFDKYYRVWPKRSFAPLILEASKQGDALSRWLGLMGESLPSVANEAYKLVPKAWRRRRQCDLSDYINFRLERLLRFAPLELERLRVRERESLKPSAEIWLGL